MVGRRGEAWNDEDVATLRAMAGQGRALREIARALERSPDAVYSRARKLKIDVGSL